MISHLDLIRVTRKHFVTEYVHMESLPSASNDYKIQIVKHRVTDVQCWCFTIKNDSEAAYDLVRKLGGLDHLNIPKLLEVFVDEGKGIHIITEKVEGGFVTQFKNLNHGRLDELVVIDIGFQLLSCVNYLHSRGLRHG